ncbi:PD-(D/E)XK nuclease family protein [Pseudomonas sp. IT-P258]|uniref:PDDEXK-like family protein n=1 Tax=Pseudomonas sp. IT-P258 TaxID=3026447 RepID=UPI0039E104C1
MSTGSSEKLRDFFDRLRNLPPPTSATKILTLSPVHLSGFFHALRAVPPDALALNRMALTPAEIDVRSLAVLFDGMRTPFQYLRAAGGFCNPWRIARLGRDEVRVTAVLAWLLDPAGDHGLGDVLLGAMMARVNRTQMQIPHTPLSRVSVIREARLNSDGNNRVDIELRSNSLGGAFYLLIEAKIDAPEGADQILRYVKAAELGAGSLPWAVIYLTTDGRASRSIVELDSRRVVNLSWKELARVLLRSLDCMAVTNPAFQGFSYRLAETFLRHVRAF